jgi:hypothetical protein
MGGGERVTMEAPGSRKQDEEEARSVSRGGDTTALHEMSRGDGGGEQGDGGVFVCPFYIPVPVRRSVLNVYFI